jgi:hypothetical protein
MKLAEVYDFLDRISPFELQEKWDNSGMLVGEMSQEVNQIVISLDIDEALLERMRALIKEYRLLLQDLIRQGQREGSLTNEVTPECLSLGLIGLPAIVAIQHRLQPDPPLEDRLEKDFVQWVIGQLGRNSQT